MMFNIKTSITYLGEWFQILFNIGIFSHVVTHTPTMGLGEQNISD